MKDADTFNPYPEITYGFPLADIASYRYIKWEITKVRDGSDTDCYTGDVCTQASEFLPTFDGFSSLVSIFDATATNPGGVNPPGQQAGYLFDGDTSTKFLDAAFSTSNNSEGSSTIIFDVFDGYEVTFNGYNWATGDDMTTRDPVSWTVSGSTDDITYELLDTQTDYATTIDRETFVGGENDNWDFYNVWGIDEEGEDNDGYPFLQWQDFEYEYSSPVDSETESPRLYTPESSSTHIDTDELEITFNLPETLLTGSLTLTFAPEEGDPIILVLDDAAPDVENSFSLTPSGGIGLVEEVVSTTADSIPGGIYTVTISYQDASGNPAATDSVTDVEIQELYVITEVTPISGNITDTSPVYHFAIDGTGEAELLVSEGCGEDILATALGDFPDDQQVQFNSLEVGQTYECTVSVNSDAGLSNELTVGPFTVISSGGSTSGTTRSARINNLRAQGKETEAQKIEQEVTKTVIPTIIPPLTRLLKYKMIGEEVRIMQQLLNKKGYTLALTGPGSPGNETQYYGPKTLAMIKKFQLANGLIPDGIVGPLTWGMLNK
jgi:hypothetical protein